MKFIGFSCKKIYRTSLFWKSGIYCFNIYLILIVTVLDVALYLEVAAALIVILTVPLLRNVIFPLEDTVAIFLLLET